MSMTQLSFLQETPTTAVGHNLTMCRSIKTLREGTTLAPSDEVEAAARQFVRKVSGFQYPAAHNHEVFEAAVQEVAASAQRLLDGLLIGGKPTTPSP